MSGFEVVDEPPLFIESLRTDSINNNKKFITRTWSSIKHESEDFDMTLVHFASKLVYIMTTLLPRRTGTVSM